MEGILVAHWICRQACSENVSSTFLRLFSCNSVQTEHECCASASVFTYERGPRVPRETRGAGQTRRAHRTDVEMPPAQWPRYRSR